MGDINDDIKRYREGSLTGPERNALEKKALNDPFLADALEGAESISPEDFTSDLSSLSKKITRDADISWFTPLRIAAGVLLLIGAGALFYWINDPEPELLASKESIPQADTLMSQVDSTTSTLLALEQAKPVDQQQAKASASTSAEKSSAGILDKAKAGEGLKQDAQPIVTEPAMEQGRDADEVSKEEVTDDIAEEEKIAQIEVEARELAKDKAALKKASPTGGADVKLDDQRERSLRGEDRSVASRFSTQNITQNITGQVTSKDDGSPIPGVNVMVKGTTQGTVTDAQGYYNLPFPGETTTLEFSFIGMKTVDTKVNSTFRNDVQMTEDATKLSEVVVTGMNLQKNAVNQDYEPVLKLASPKGGIRAYNRYLEKNVKYSAEARAKKVKGKVMIGFTVTTEGQLTDFSVIKSLGFGCDEELIRLVKEGPAWSPSTQDDVAVESEVKVRLKFDSEKAGK